MSVCLKLVKIRYRLRLFRLGFLSRQRRRPGPSTPASPPSVLHHLTHIYSLVSKIMLVELGEKRSKTSWRNRKALQGRYGRQTNADTRELSDLRAG